LTYFSPKYLAKLVQFTREKITYTHFFPNFPFFFCGNNKQGQKIVGEKKRKKISLGDHRGRQIEPIGKELAPVDFRRGA
jgi:hypothetical protein